MSQNVTQDEYLRMVGAQVLADQLAAQQQQQKPSDVATQQNLRNWQLMAQRNLAQQRRKVEEARERQAAMLKQRERERQDEIQIQAVINEAETKEAARKEWVLAGNFPSDFEKQWDTQYLAIQQSRAAEHQEAVRASWLQRIGGNPF